MTNSPTLPELQEKFSKLQNVLNTELVERFSEIQVSLTAIVAGQHVFLYGPPGVAKSMLVNRLEKYISGASKFSVLLSRFSTPEEVLGPKSLAAMKRDEDKRNIDGYLPTASLAFIDEIFKANSSILNALLQAINERLYRHGTEMLSIPLSTLFCASNELPQDESLNALYDRLLVRLEVKGIQDHQSFLQMLNTSHSESPTPILTWDDIEAAKKEAANVIISDEVYEGLIKIRRALSSENIHPTDRRFHQSLDLVRAAAWLDGETTAYADHLLPLQHVLWDQPEQQQCVTNIVISASSPINAEALQMLDELTQIRTQIELLIEEHTSGKLKKIDFTKQSMTYFNSTEKFMGLFDELEKKMTHRSKQSPIIEKCRSQLSFLTNAFQEDVFKLGNAQSKLLSQ